MVDVGFEPTTQKTHGLSTTPLAKELVGVLVRLTTCQRSTNSLPKLSLVTLDTCRRLKISQSSFLGCIYTVPKRVNVFY